jgi:anti-anti-sigma factor
MASPATFNCDVEKSTEKDEHGNEVITVRCHGRLVSDTTGKIKEVVHPLLGHHGRIVIDLGDVAQLDSSGLGTLVGLKASAVRQGLCLLEFSNMTPRILELLRITNLMQILTSQPTQKA